MREVFSVIERCVACYFSEFSDKERIDAEAAYLLDFERKMIEKYMKQ